MIDNEIYLGYLGAVIKISLLPIKDLIAQEIFVNTIKTFWGNYIIRKSNPDYLIIVKDFGYDIFRKKNTYYLKKYVKNSDRYDLSYYSSAKEIDLILREIFSDYLEGRGLILHASAVLDSKNRAFVFIAKSGEGKSTISRNLEYVGYKIIADDCLVCINDGKKWKVSSAPFLEKTKYPLTDQANIFTLFQIHKSEECQSKVIDNKYRKTKNIAGSLWLEGKIINKKRLGNIMDLSSKIKMYDLHVNLNPIDIKKEIQKCTN